MTMGSITLWGPLLPLPWGLWPGWGGTGLFLGSGLVLSLSLLSWTLGPSHPDTW